jgi:predicted Fe-S protein YdhL (DUF1289 family)
MAQEYLEALKIQDWSHMTEESRAKMWANIQEKATPKEARKAQDSNQLSNEDLAKWLAGAISG